MWPKNKTSAKSWPANGIEKVTFCPVCNSKERDLLYSNLQDLVYFCAPDEWTLYRCRDCRTGYLDPRPTSDTIQLAYKNYFTHNNIDQHPRTLTRPFSRLFVNGYRNWRYGTNAKPSTSIGIAVTLLQPGRRSQIDTEMRHIPKPWPGARLLDLGCGNGEFLTWARDMGWQVVGIDTDPAAVEIATQQGLKVHLGSIETLSIEAAKFDMITLSHVIEHLHSPLLILKKCFELLKDNGTIWIETPNLESIGHDMFGCHWRGLEPPRHLSIFTHKSLEYLLHNVGFKHLKIMPYRPVCNDIFRMSRAIELASHGSRLSQNNSIKNILLTIQAESIEKRNPEKREFVTLCGKK